VHYYYKPKHAWRIAFGMVKNTSACSLPVAGNGERKAYVTEA
jgi:hypothetical protein